MDNLSPGARATLLVLRDQPGNVHEVAERTGRSRSGTDKALRELARADLIVKVDGGDPADGAPTRWQHTDRGAAATAELQAAQAGPGNPGPGTDDDAGSPEAPPASEAAGTGADSESEPPLGGTGPDTHTADQPTGEAATGDQTDAAGQVDTTAGGTTPSEADEPKICRGCGEQLPRICPHCWQKTPSYCGKCRKDMPQARRGEPGEPTILPSGLPRLRPGELEQLVLNVIQQQPLPNHVGITGWTAQRVAIYLPGRSTGAIGNALNKLTKTGQVELIGEQPMRYQLTTSAQSADGDMRGADADRVDTAQVPASAGSDQPPSDG
jgi:DNA-binding MarR family transcriptional regulator